MLKKSILFKWLALWALGLGLVISAQAETSLKHWPPEAATQLEALIKNNANKGAFAVFDADNTSYNNDLEESLLPFLEMKGILSRDKLDPVLKPIPFKDIDGHKESLNSYYYRLCEIDDQVCYPWVAQVFSGYTLRELKGWIDEMLAKGQTSLEQIEARALIRDGVLITETVQARAGAMGLAASGRVDLAERTLDLHLSVKPSVPADRPLKPADMAGAEAVTVRGFWQEPYVHAQEASADAPR